MEVGTDIRLSNREHAVKFYDDEEELEGLTAGYLAAALADGEQAVVIATPEHRQRFQASLGARGVDVATAQAAGHLLMLDAAETMARFLVDGLPHAADFEATLGFRLRQAAAGGRSVRVYGEMVSLLWDAGEQAAVMELERLWDELIAHVPCSLLCAYPMSSMGPSATVAAFNELCRLHSGVIGGPPEPQGAECTVCFPCARQAPTHARGFVAESLLGWGRSDLLDVGALVVTELATNAIRHANSGFTVSLVRDGGVVRLFVGDNARTVPQLQATGPSESGGRGLQIIDALAERWGHDLHPSGKLVWAELAAEGGAAGRPG